MNYSEGKTDDEARALVAQLSLEEQVSLLAGSDFWRTVALPERGIPSIKTTDGPNGARGEFFKNGTPAALFPCGVSLAATWNTSLTEQVGKALADETKARGADVLLAPTICMHRSPLGGRNFESFSEDPYLTGKLAASYVRGLQSCGVAATIKHFAGNEQETLRTSIDSLISLRALREVYMKPFEIVMRDCPPWALMTSYNKVNGVHSDMNSFLLKDVLRSEWEFDGLVMSDWNGTNSTAQSIDAGCDLEMPGPAKWRGTHALTALKQGKLSREAVEKAAANVLFLVDRTRGLHGGPEPTEKALDTPQTRQLIRQAGTEGIVLLKNEQSLLPIRGARKIALIGPNANRAIVGGGGSASLNPYYTTTPFEAISAKSDATVCFAPGCDTSKWLPLASEVCKTAEGQRGVVLEYYKGDKLEGSPIEVQHKEKTDLFLWDSAPKSVLPEYSFKVTAQITPRTTGRHTFSFSSVGPGRMMLDGKLFIDNWDWTEEGEAMFEASQDVLQSINLKADVPVHILVESNNEVRPASKMTPDGPRHGYGGCRIGYQEESRIDLLKEAVDIARDADVAIVCVGLDAEYESEGYDRQTMDLPKNGSQDMLIDAVVKANPKTIVVNQSGTPVTMPWADKVPSILQAWYQGQEAGNALADILFGEVSPSGKLPTTFPRNFEDNPAHGNWPGKDGVVRYEEDIFVGYRHYERMNTSPLFAFGHGLAYTTFLYGFPSSDTSTLIEGARVVVSLTVTNVGETAAAEIVQGYVKFDKSNIKRPEKELQAFTKVFLQPEESKDIELVFDKYSVGSYDVDRKLWVAEPGEYRVLIGASSVDIR
ncbi:glycoside hydrolase family 3 protein [Aulographum hederae CBS 113979]|uniref:beta-glucosidase n=1 Tax=Aulographum hederae CBS 113979 TaxID=1176131 RepID=A0A6G1H8T9_9PEZI|nr:glycoside hydrolase family 3 protein [Aulographum hederae CBS 113979]